MIPKTHITKTTNRKTTNKKTTNRKTTNRKTTNKKTSNRKISNKRKTSNRNIFKNNTPFRGGTVSESILSRILKPIDNLTDDDTDALKLYLRSIIYKMKPSIGIFTIKDACKWIVDTSQDILNYLARMQISSTKPPYPRLTVFIPGNSAIMPILFIEDEYQDKLQLYNIHFIKFSISNVKEMSNDTIPDFNSNMHSSIFDDSYKYSTDIANIFDHVVKQNNIDWNDIKHNMVIIDYKSPDVFRHDINRHAIDILSESLKIAPQLPDINKLKNSLQEVEDINYDSSHINHMIKNHTDDKLISLEENKTPYKRMTYSKKSLVKLQKLQDKHENIIKNCILSIKNTKQNTRVKTIDFNKFFNYDWYQYMDLDFFTQTDIARCTPSNPEYKNYENKQFEKIDMVPCLTFLYAAKVYKQNKNSALFQ
tara:strand:- start:3385 stop:4650 length:1266 start_codon:yes stop_codon:yes gene_type:complete